MTLSLSKTPALLEVSEHWPKYVMQNLVKIDEFAMPFYVIRATIQNQNTQALRTLKSRDQFNVW